MNADTTPPQATNEQESRRILVIGVVCVLAAALLCAGGAAHVYSWIAGADEALYVGAELPESARDDLVLRDLISSDDEVVAYFYVHPMRSLWHGSLVTADEVIAFTESDAHPATLVHRLPLADVGVDQGFEPTTGGSSPELLVRADDGESVTLRLPQGEEDLRRFLEVFEAAVEAAR